MPLYRKTFRQIYREFCGILDILGLEGLCKRKHPLHSDMFRNYSKTPYWAKYSRKFDKLFDFFYKDNSHDLKWQKLVIALVQKNSERNFCLIKKAVYHPVVPTCEKYIRLSRTEVVLLDNCFDTENIIIFTALWTKIRMKQAPNSIIYMRYS